VDNGSNDGSFELLKRHFRKVPHVTLKKLKKNLGFARGNNAGIRYARKHLGAENCFVCNSDVVFGSTLFQELLAAAEKGVGVISPTVLDAEHNPQPLSVNTRNPYSTIALTWLYVLYKSLPDNLRKELLPFFQTNLFGPSWKLVKAVYELSVLILEKYGPAVKREGEKIIKSRRKSTGPKKPGVKSPDSKNLETKSPNIRNAGARSLGTISSARKGKDLYQIQGCAFLLTKEYFRFYTQLYPKTFLYGEELNLALYLKKAGLRAVVADTSPVIHKGKQSSKEFTQKEGEKKRLMFARHSLFQSLPLVFLGHTTIKKLF